MFLDKSRIDILIRLFFIADATMDTDQLIKELSHNEKKVLLALEKLNGKATPENLQKKGEFTQIVEVMNAASWLQSKKLITIEEHITKVYTLGKEGKRFLQKGLPEKRALTLLSQKNGKIAYNELTTILEPDEITIAIGWMRRNNWITITKSEGTILEITEQGKQAINQQTNEEKILHQLKENIYTEIPASDIKSLLTRKNVVKEKELISSTILLTEQGKQLLKKGIPIEEEISQITSTIIKNQEWKQKTIRPYDIRAFAPKLNGGKPHPLINLISKIRNIFIAMGFEEIQGDYVESCFWDMDMLFIPQDHPAREMQDTFYCKKPSRKPVTDEHLIQKIAQVHENGGNTGSKGWGYTFSRTDIDRVLLRTHTTVNTITYLYHNPEPPSKVFSIGRVFRKENIDTTHLPEFYQIEGIIQEKTTNFRQLMGVLREFYRRMGFEKIRLRPSYYPYTEPSMDVEVFWNNKWMELGGSGIFRPEVTEPIGVKYPVLAWGLGLERLAMLQFGLHDIRSLYLSDIEWLQKQPLL